MGLLDRMVRGAERRTLLSGLANPSEFLVEALSTGRTLSGQRVTVDRAFGLAPVWSAVSIIAETLGGLPLKVYRDIGDGDRVAARDHRAYRMLHDQPNPVVPAFRFWSTCAVHLLLRGNAFIEKLRGASGLVEELWLLDPAITFVDWDPGLRRKRFVQDTQAGRRVWSEADVLHITGLSSDGLIGESVISRCRNTLGTAMARDEFEGSFYKVGGTSRGIVQHPGRLKAEGIENLRKGLDAVLGGSKNTGRTGVLEEGATWQSISMPLADMEFVASQHLTRTDVALMFKLPPAYLGGSTGDSLTYSTVESNQIQFAQNAIAPWANTIAKALASDPGIFPYSAWYPEFMLEGLMRGDHGARAGFYEKMFNLVDGDGRRALTVDEIRARESLPPAEKEPQPPAAAPPPPGANGNGNGNGLTPADLAAMARGAVS